MKLTLQRLLILLITSIYLCLALPIFAADNQQMAHVGTQKITGDYDGMVERRTIRALVPYSKTFYFLDKATARGVSHDLLKEFEKEINISNKNKHLKVNVIIIPTSRDQLLPRLAEGFGDLAAGNLTITDKRKESVDFSVPAWSGVDEVVITGTKSPQIANINELSGKEVYVRKSSSYYEHLVGFNKTLSKKGDKIVTIVEADENLEDEDIIEMINAGLVQIGIVDSHKAAFWSQIFPDIKVHSDIKINSGGEIAWAMRKNSPQLKEVVDKFIKKNKKGTLMGNILIKRYLKNTKYIKNSLDDEELNKFEQTLSLFKKYADQYDFDWLMLAALSYQESGIDQSKVSHVGAVGAMQVLPSTAKDKNVNIPDISTIESNIHAGTKYLRFMMDRYYANEPMDRVNKALFTFASYNAGPAKVAKLRKEAESMGLDQNVWFRNVEVVAAKRIGRETVQYVSNIYKYYIAYKLIVDDLKL